MNDENSPLIRKESNSGLSLLFATFCIIDIFGVFPIIALPRAIVQCGLYGISLVLIILILQIYTAILLGKSWVIVSSLDPYISQKNRYPLAAVTEVTLGPKCRTLVTALLDLTIFGAGIPNLLVASQNLQLFGLKISEHEFNVSFCYWLILVGILLCPLMWLGSPRDMKWLATCSTVTVCVTAVLIWWSIAFDDRELNVLPVPTSPTLEKFIAGYGMLAFQFDVHPTLMTVQVDMRKPQKIDRAIVLSFLGSGVLFSVTTVLSVWKYGGSTTANVLQAVPPGYIICAVILISALQLCFSSSLGHSALFQHLEEQLHVERTFGWKRIVTRSAVVFLAVAIGESVPRFDVVMALIGGTLTGPLIFIFPPLIYSQARALKEKAERQSLAPEIFIANNTKLENSSYDYYDHEIHPEEYSDIEVDQLFNIKQRSNGMNNGKQNGNLMLLEATRIHNMNRLNREKYNKDVSHSCFSCRTLMDLFGYFIVIFGVLITISSTYINIKNTIKFVEFSPPCITNASVQINIL